MSLKVLKKSEVVHVVDFKLCFGYVDDPEYGYAFQCNADGEVCAEVLRGPSKANYEMCLRETSTFLKRVCRWEHSYRTDTVMECHCGAAITFGGRDEDCPICGCLYNCWGQELRRLSPEEEAEEALNDWQYEAEEIRG